MTLPVLNYKCHISFYILTGVRIHAIISKPSNKQAAYLHFICISVTPTNFIAPPSTEKTPSHLDMHDRPKLVDGQEKGCLQVALKTHHWTYSPDTNLQ